LVNLDIAEKPIEKPIEKANEKSTTNKITCKFCSKTSFDKKCGSCSACCLLRGPLCKVSGHNSAKRKLPINSTILTLLTRAINENKMINVQYYSTAGSEDHSRIIKVSKIYKDNKQLQRVEIINPSRGNNVEQWYLNAFRSAQF